MREITLTDMERLGAFDEAERTFQMTEEAFRSFYELTARPVRVYLVRMTGDDRLADDLLQETYYRFLRANVAFSSDDHRRNYLFRIATNLVHELWVSRLLPAGVLTQARTRAVPGFGFLVIPGDSRKLIFLQLF